MSLLFWVLRVGSGGVCRRQHTRTHTTRHLNTHSRAPYALTGCSNTFISSRTNMGSGTAPSM